MTEDGGFTGHQHYCCVECGSLEQVTLMGGATICFNCIKEFKKKHNIEFIILDETVGRDYNRMKKYLEKEEEIKDDKSFR